MHLALPKKRLSITPTYSTRSSRYPILRRSRVKTIVISILTTGILLYIILRVISSSNTTLNGNPSVVVVTVLDYGKYNEDYIEDIKQNRINYAEKHGYATFFPNVTDFELEGAPSSWAIVPAIRYTISKYDQCKYIWYLNYNSVIMNPNIKVDGDIMRPAKLENMIMGNQPVVPPNSVIKTFHDLKASNIELVLTQDKSGLVSGSFIVRRGCWSKFFLDVWFDPLYRSYNFQKAQTHALEHIVQWHPTILSKLALIPQRMLNSYINPDLASETGIYEEGDFAVELTGCDQTGRDCAAETRPFLNRSKMRKSKTQESGISNFQGSERILQRNG